MTATMSLLTLFGACDDDAASRGASGDASTTGDSSPGVDGPVDATPSEDGAGHDAGRDAPTDGSGDTGTTLALTSASFVNGAAIPDIHTCGTGTGISNQSPPLAWTGAPTNALSFAIVVRDTSLATANNYHWVIFDLPASTTSLAAGVPRTAAPATPPEAVGSTQTYWSFGNLYGYGGPCPPVGDGPHTYRFTVYAFASATVPVPGGTTSPDAADAIIQANAIASASLTGTYER